jgi:hypothetical protein
LLHLHKRLCCWKMQLQAVDVGQHLMVYFFRASVLRRL